MIYIRCILVFMIGLFPVIANASNHLPEVQTLISNLNSPGPLDVADDFVFVAEKDGTVKSIPIDGGSSTIMATGLSNPVDMVADFEAIWVTHGQG